MFPGYPLSIYLFEGTTYWSTLRIGYPLVLGHLYHVKVLSDSDDRNDIVLTFRRSVIVRFLEQKAFWSRVSDHSK